MFFVMTSVFTITPDDVVQLIFPTVGIFVALWLIRTR